MSSDNTFTEYESIPLDESIKGSTTASSYQSAVSSEEERKKRRRHANKVSSRKARIRQKVYIEELHKQFASLQEQLRLLKQENLQLRLLIDNLWRVRLNNAASGQSIGSDINQLAVLQEQQYQAMPQRSTHNNPLGSTSNLPVTNIRLNNAAGGQSIGSDINQLAVLQEQQYQAMPQRSFSRHNNTKPSRNALLPICQIRIEELEDDLLV